MLDKQLIKTGKINTLIETKENVLTGEDIFYNRGLSRKVDEVLNVLNRANTEKFNSFLKNNPDKDMLTVKVLSNNNQFTENSNSKLQGLYDIGMNYKSNLGKKERKLIYDVHNPPKKW